MDKQYHLFDFCETVIYLCPISDGALMKSPLNLVVAVQLHINGL